MAALRIESRSPAALVIAIDIAIEHNKSARVNQRAHETERDVNSSKEAGCLFAIFFALQLMSVSCGQCLKRPSWPFTVKRRHARVNRIHCIALFSYAYIIEPPACDIRAHRAFIRGWCRSKVPRNRETFTFEIATGSICFLLIVAQDATMFSYNVSSHLSFLFIFYKRRMIAKRDECNARYVSRKRLAMEPTNLFNFRPQAVLTLRAENTRRPVFPFGRDAL